MSSVAQSHCSHEVNREKWIHEKTWKWVKLRFYDNVWEKNTSLFSPIFKMAFKRTSEVFLVDLRKKYIEEIASTMT